MSRSRVCFGWGQPACTPIPVAMSDADPAQSITTGSCCFNQSYLVPKCIINLGAGLCPDEVSPDDLHEGLLLWCPWLSAAAANMETSTQSDEEDTDEADLHGSGHAVCPTEAVTTCTTNLQLCMPTYCFCQKHCMLRANASWAVSVLRYRNLGTASRLTSSGNDTRSHAITWQDIKTSA